MDQALQQSAEIYSVVKEQMMLQQACDPSSKLVKATADASQELDTALLRAAVAAATCDKQRQEAVQDAAMQQCWATTLLSDYWAGCLSPGGAGCPAAGSPEGVGQPPAGEAAA
jgi:hypothetical protein